MSGKIFHGKTMSIGPVHGQMSASFTGFHVKGRGIAGSKYGADWNDQVRPPSRRKSRSKLRMKSEIGILQRTEIRRGSL